MAKLSDLLDRIFASALDRDGYFTAADMRAQEVSDADLYRLVNRGDIERVNRGVYRLVRFPRSPNGDLWAAALWAQPAVLSHSTALRLYGLIDEQSRLIDITVPSDTRLRKESPPQYRLHAADLTDADSDVIDRLPVTNLRRTILDLYVDGEIDRERLRSATRTARERGLLDASTADQLLSILGAEHDLLGEVVRLHAEHQRSLRNERRTTHALPVLTIANDRLAVASPEGTGVIPIYATSPLDRPQPSIERAFVLFHGALRDADNYFTLAQAAVAAGRATRTLAIVPQILAEQDLDAHALPPDTLRWKTWEWMGGGIAAGPAPLSTFCTIDALIAVLADRKRFPALREIVLVGHSAGAQLVQRYAAVGRALSTPSDVVVRFVVANASTYLYFDATRPNDNGGFDVYDERLCPGFNRWKYGLEDRPEYAGSRDAAQIESDYACRNVTYLLGTADADPAHSALDRSCAALAQGPHRHARGHAYFSYLLARHGDALEQCVVDVPDIGHDSSGIFTSPQGLAAIFEGGSK